MLQKDEGRPADTGRPLTEITPTAQGYPDCTGDSDNFGDGTNERALTLSLLACTLRAPAADVVDVFAFVDNSDIRLLDAPTAIAVGVALEIASAGIAPDAVLVNAELLRRGLLDGHQGYLLRDRLLAAVTADVVAAQLRPIAAATLAVVFRLRLVAVGESLATRGRTGAEDDAWETLVREGAAIRMLRDRLVTLRGDGQ